MVPTHSWTWTHRSKRNFILNPIMYLSTTTGPTLEYPVILFPATQVNLQSHPADQRTSDRSSYFQFNWKLTSQKCITTQNNMSMLPHVKYYWCKWPWYLSVRAVMSYSPQWQYCRKTHTFPKQRPAFPEMVWSHLKLLRKYSYFFKTVWYSQTFKFPS